MLPLAGVRKSGQTAERLKAAREHLDTFTINIANGQASVEENLPPGKLSSQHRIDNQLTLINPIIQYLSNLSATFTIHDGPLNIIPYTRREQLVTCATSDEPTCESSRETRSG